MGDFQDFSLRNYSEWEFIKLDEIIILYSLQLPSRECEKFSIIQDVDINSKFYKKVVE
jgi:hypothetical protein